MGQSKTKVQRFIADNPTCIFCGGTSPATTQDHVPARSLFIDRKWPEGYVFPACLSCNNSTSDAECLASLLIAIGWEFLEGDEDIKKQSLQKVREFTVRKPELSRQIVPASTNQKRAFAKEIEYSLPQGATHSQIPLARIPEAFNSALNTLGTKLAKALHYLHSGKTFIVPADAEITVYQETNADWMRKGSTHDYELFRTLFPVQNLIREKVDLTAQFSYAYGMTPDNRNSAFICKFGNIFTLAMFIILDGEEYNDSVVDSVSALTSSH